MAKGNMTAADAAKNMTSNMSSTVKAMNETIETRDRSSSAFFTDNCLFAVIMDSMEQRNFSYEVYE
jgi:hypothetical protein